MTSFDQDPDIYARWWVALTDATAALGLLEELFDQDKWKQWPEPWLNCLSVALCRQSTRGSASELRSRVIVQLTKDSKIDEQAFVAIPALFRMTVPLSELDVQALSQWLSTCAEPNDASLIADALDATVWTCGLELVRACRPLFDWAYGMGSSEFRAPRRADLNAKLLDHVLDLGWDDLLLPAVRFLMYHPPRLDHYFPERQGIAILASAIERHLADAGSSAIVGDVGGALASGHLQLYLDHVLRRPNELALSRKNLIHRLASGDIQLQDPARIWSLVVGGPAEPISIRQAHTSRQALDGLVVYARDRWRGHGLGKPPPPRDAEERAWAVSIFDAFLRTTDVLRAKRPADITRLEHFFVGDVFNRNIVDALHAGALSAVGDSSDPASATLRDLLGSPGVGPEVVQALLPLLRRASVPSAPSNVVPTDDELGPVRSILQELLERRREHTRGFDLLAFLDGVRRVSFGELENERAFEIHEDVLMLPRTSIADIVALQMQPVERDATAVLYCLHELLHEAQGIADKQEVNRVRFAGAESALMHLDLGADHVAAGIASSAFPQWDLLWLKDVQGRSLVAFPAGPRHPQFARIRKVLRLVSLRADRLMRLRELGDLGNRTGSYGFVDFGPGGGPIAFLVNWPPFVVIKTASLSSAQASLLFEGIDGPNAIEGVDDVLSAVLDTSG